MGCTPSKSVGTYNQDTVYGDLDTGSTIVPSVKSSVSTPERPPPCVCVETNSGKQTFLNVPGRDLHGRSVSQPSSPEAWSAWSALSTAASSSNFGVKPNIMEAVYGHDDPVNPEPSAACSKR